MKSGFSCVLNACIYAVVLNLVLPMVAKPFATKDEIKPPNGADKLSFKSQVMHMLVHHAQVPSKRPHVPWFSREAPSY